MNDKIYLSSPHMCGKEIEYVNDAFEKNWIAPLGENVNNFEKDIEIYLNKDVFVSALSSGTAALHLALLLANVEKDDFVICQSLTFVASANAINYIGAIPIFIDSETETNNLCPNYVEDAIKKCILLGKKPKAIITVNLYGMPYKHSEIKELSLKYNIPIIEDAAESLGSIYKNEKCGTLGDFSIFSFNGNKIITTSGGGALITKKITDKNKAIFLSTQAKEKKIFYEHKEVGYNYRMSNICAGIGRGQMQVIDLRVKQRRDNFLFYKEFFKKYNFISVVEEPSKDYFSNHWLTSIKFDEKSNINLYNIIEKMSSKNIEVRNIWKPMHLQPLYKKNMYFGGNNSEFFFNFGLCLPSSSNLTEINKLKIKNTLEEILNEYS